MVARSVLIASLFVHSAPGAPITAPNTSLATLPVGYFGGNEQARPEENLQMLSKMRIVVIEKWEGRCWNECIANQTAGATGCDPGCRQEDITLETLAEVKKLNPSVAAVFYLNSWFDFQFYDLHRRMAEADLLLKDADTGKVALVQNDNGLKNNNVFDFTKKEARDMWVQMVKDLVATGNVDGIFADKYVIRASESSRGSTGWATCNGKKDCVILTKEQAEAYNAGKEAMLKEVTDFLGPEALYWYSTTSSLKKVDNKEPKDIKADFDEKRKNYRYVYMQHQDQHSNHDPTQISSSCSTDLLAKFLLIVEEGLFIGCNGWDQQFENPLGDPLGPMDESSNGVLSRKFASGTTVSWNPKAKEGSRGTITWANQPGPSPSPSPVPPPPAPTPTPTPTPTPAPIPAECGQAMYDTSSSSGDLKLTTKTDSLEECCAACLKEPQCKAWTWYSDGTNACHLRDSLVTKHKLGRISGLLPAQVVV